MEQRKLLWVILLVSLFVLMIFGAALILYSPSRSSNTAYADGEVIQYDGTYYDEKDSVDPDKWTRDPEQVAELDKNAAPANGNIINLTIVNDGQSFNDKNIDVSDLTENQESTENKLPPELAEQVGIGSPEREKTAEPVEAEKPAVSTKKEVKPAPSKVQKRKLVASKKKKPQRKAVKKAPAQKKVFWVQTASLKNRLNAEKARDRLAAQHMQVEIFTKKTASGLTYRVRVGPFLSKAEAQYWLNNIKKIKDFSESYISQSTVKR